MKVLYFPVVAFLLFAFASLNPTQAGSDIALPSRGQWGVDLGDRDPSVKAGDNFYMSQNGGWFNRTELTPSQPTAAYWRDIRRAVPAQIIGILKELSSRKDFLAGSPEDKVSAFYHSFMDEDSIEKIGSTPFQPILTRLKAIKSKSELARFIGQSSGPGSSRAPSLPSNSSTRQFFSLSIGQDNQDLSRNAVFLSQGGLVLPGPEFYSDPKLADFKSAYQSYVAGTLTNLSWPNAEDRAKEIVELETRIAAVSWSHEQMVHAAGTYHPMTTIALSRFAPGFDWAAYLKGAGLERARAVVIDADTAFPKIAKIYADTPLDLLKARQTFIEADYYAPFMNKSFNAPREHFMDLFRNRLLFGNRELRAETAAELYIPDLVAKLYVARYSSPAARSGTLEIAKNLRTALDKRLQTVPWMTSATKAEARAKLANMTIRIGFPDTFDTYPGLVIKDRDLFGNIVRSNAYHWSNDLKKLSKPFDSSQWTLTPMYPQYFYTPTTNTVEIPAALLQPPFYDVNADDAVNYGAVGALIGQDIMSAFDDQGRHYDKNGRLRDWWTEEESKYFDTEAKKLSAQYSEIEPIPGTHVNGQLVLSEALSDLGSLTIALDAYHLSQANKEARVLDGFTGDQRFFLGRAQMWRAKFPLNFTRTQLATGANAPPLVRVNGPVRNLDTWYAAFNVQPGDKMYLAPENRVHLW